jgi:hypothetical protein
VRMNLICFTLAFLFALSALSAQSGERYRRNVEFEWDAIEGAQSYDLEIQKGDKTLKFTTKQSQWVGNLVPGMYKMKIRAKDHRGVPADWSPPEDFKVGLETAKLTTPKPQDQIQSGADEKYEVVFSWEPVKAAESYVFELVSDDGTIKQTETVKENRLTLNLPVAQKYTWKVNALGMGMDSDSLAADQFTVLGKKIKSPTLVKPETEFVRSMKWDPAPFATNYSYTLFRWDAKAKAWEKVEQKEDMQETELVFPPDYPGGRYRFQIKAQNPLRVPSALAQMDFKVKTGDRSPAAEETATLRMSIERLNGWYTIASYLITMVDYKGINFDRSNSVINYSAIGGTGRLGAGYLSPKSPWGFLGIADLGGITVVNASNYTYASLEANGIHRRSLGDRGELRQQIGFFYKELPETIGKTSDAITAMNLVKTIGPHYGIEYWWALSSKWGFQVNTHLYPSLMKINTPNGQNIQPSLSTQFGLLASYRLQRNLTGLAGYAFRQDQISYKAEPGQGSAGSNDFNKVELSGHYLNLFLEWAL